MVDFHRLNPNALLVLLGTVIYVVVGGPWLVVGGVTVAFGLGALHRPRGTETDGNGPMSLFGAPVTALPRSRPIIPRRHLCGVPVMA